MPRERTSDIVVDVVLACLWLVLIVAGFGAINFGREIVLTLYVLVAATAIALGLRWLWKRKAG